MRRLARRLFNLVTAVSLLLFVAVCVVWVRSYGVSDQIDWRGAAGWRSVHSARGHVVVSLLVADRPTRPDQHHRPKYTRRDARPPFNSFKFLGGYRGDRHASWERGRFAWYEVRNAPRGTLQAIAVAPCWSVASLAAVPPAAWASLRLRALARRRRRTRSGLCPACGYDLRATPDRCPECGAVPAAAGRNRGPQTTPSD